MIERDDFTRNKFQFSNILMVLFFALSMLFVPSCGGGGGGGGGGSTGGGGTTTPPPAADTTAPAIAFTYPADGAEFTMPSTPGKVDLAYSDNSGAVSVSSLSVSMTLNGRTVSLTDLFPKLQTTNANTTSTSPGTTDPLMRTTVSMFSDSATSFTTPIQSLSVQREGNGSLSLSCIAGSEQAYAWNPSDSEVYAMTFTGTAAVSAVSLGFAPSALESATDRGKFYVARSGVNTLYVYNSLTNQSQSSVPLPDEPILLSYHSETGKLYIAYKTRLKIGRLDVTAGTLDAYEVSVDNTPALIQTRHGSATGGVFAVIATGGKFHLFEYDAAGATARDVQLDLFQPSDVEFVSSGYVYLTNYSSNSVTRVNLADNTRAEISVGQFPRKMFAAGSGSVYVFNSGGRSMTLVSGSSAQTTYSFTPMPIDGSYGCSTGRILTVEDLWTITTRVPATLTATVRDNSGNTGSTSITIYIKPESLGGV